MTIYCTPFNALIPELGRTQEARVNVSTYISFTFIIGTATAYLLPNIAGFMLYLPLFCNGLPLFYHTSPAVEGYFAAISE